MAGTLREGLSLEDFLRAALSLPFHIAPGVALVHVRLGGLVGSWCPDASDGDASWG